MIPNEENKREQTTYAETRVEETVQHAERQEDQAMLQQKAKRKKRWIIFGVSGGVLAVCVLIVSIVLVWKVFIPGMNYGKGKALLQAGNHSEAYLAFKAAGNYADTKEILKDFLFLPAKGTYTSISDGEKRTYDQSYTYDERGNQTKRTFGDIVYEYIYEYDDHYNIISKYEIRDGEVTSEEHSEYDDKGAVTKHQYKSKDVFDPDDVYEYNYEYDREYDDKGKLIWVTSVKNGTDTEKTYYEYDQKGNLICATRTKDGVEIGKTHYEYDADGNLRKYYSDEITMEYNSHGDIVLYESKSDLSGEYKTTYSYEYDDTYGWANKVTSTRTSDGEEDITITEYQDYTILYCPKK